jgi:hypothetical protein
MIASMRCAPKGRCRVFANLERRCGFFPRTFKNGNSESQTARRHREFKED